MKLKRLMGLAGLVALFAVVAVVAVTGKRPEWTTSSPQALAEFTKGLEALEKIYRAEASADFAKAVEIDPNFVAAKYFLLKSMDTPSSDPQAAKLIAELGNADLAKLTDRERFLIRYTLAAHAKEAAKAEGILQAYAAEKPDDPFALDAQADRRDRSPGLDAGARAAHPPHRGRPEPRVRLQPTRLPGDGAGAASPRPRRCSRPTGTSRRTRPTPTIRSGSC